MTATTWTLNNRRLTGCPTEMHESWFIDPERQPERSAQENREDSSRRGNGQPRPCRTPPASEVEDSTLPRQNPSSGIKGIDIWLSSPSVNNPSGLPSSRQDNRASKSSARRDKRSKRQEGIRRFPSYATLSIDGSASPPPAYGIEPASPARS